MKGTFRGQINLPRKYCAARKDELISSGFSLIELVVVVAVLAILSSIFFSSYAVLTRDARISVAKKSLANIMKECLAKSLLLGREARISEIRSANSTLNYYGDRFGLKFMSDGFTYDTSLTSNQQIRADSGCYSIAAKSNTDAVNGQRIGRYPHFMIEFSNGMIQRTCSVDGPSTFNEPVYCDTTTTPNSW